MLTKVRNVLAGKKFYLTCVAAILAAIIGYADGTLTLLQLIEVIFLTIAGIAGKAGITREIKNSKPPLIVNQNKQ